MYLSLGRKTSLPNLVIFANKGTHKEFVPPLVVVVLVQHSPPHRRRRRHEVELLRFEHLRRQRRRVLGPPETLHRVQRPAVD